MPPRRPLTPGERKGLFKQYDEIERKQNELALQATRRRIPKADQFKALEAVRHLEDFKADLAREIMPSAEELRIQGYRLIPYEYGTAEFARYLAYQGLTEEHLRRDKKGRYWEPPTKQ